MEYNPSKTEQLFQEALQLLQEGYSLVSQTCRQMAEVQREMTKLKEPKNQRDYFSLRTTENQAGRRAELLARELHFQTKRYLWTKITLY